MEAHAEDEWPISSSRNHPKNEVVNIKQHETFSQRLMAARSLYAANDLHKCNLRVLTDTMDNEFNDVFGAWPLRYFVFGKNGSLELFSEPNGDRFSSKELKQYLKSKEDLLGNYDHHY